MNSTPKKKGPLSQEDKEYILKNAGRLTPNEISQSLNRAVKGIINFMKDNGLMKLYVPETQTSNSLSKTPYWRDLVIQFDEEELRLMDYHWKRVIDQFKDDIYHTEELQILDMIKMEVLANRVLSDQSNIKRKIKQLEEDIINEKLKNKGKDSETIQAKEAQIAALYSAYETIGKDHSNLLKAKTDIFKSLKATREQRYKQIENSKESLIDWVKIMIEDRERRRKIGVELEKHRLAAEVEYQRLSEYHTYADGIVDKPILNSKTVQTQDE